MHSDLQRVLNAIREMPADELPHIIGQIEEVRVTAMMRLSAPTLPAQQTDSLLNVAEAAERLGMSENYLYRHARTFPFTRYEGRSVRFSSLGIDRYINQRRK